MFSGKKKKVEFTPLDFQITISKIEKFTSMCPFRIYTLPFI